jgi:hypothetical protein
VAPKVASAPRGPGPATLARYLAQSLPRAQSKKSQQFEVCFKGYVDQQNPFSI